MSSSCGDEVQVKMWGWGEAHLGLRLSLDGHHRDEEWQQSLDHHRDLHAGEKISGRERKNTRPVVVQATPANGDDDGGRCHRNHPQHKTQLAHGGRYADRHKHAVSSAPSFFLSDGGHAAG